MLLRTRESAAAAAGLDPSDPVESAVVSRGVTWGFLPASWVVTGLAPVLSLVVSLPPGTTPPQWLTWRAPMTVRLPARPAAAAAAWIVGAVTYLVAEAVTAAAHTPSYSYLDDYISDLGVPGRPLAPLMNLAFCVQGALFLAGALLATGGRHRPLVACAALNALGNVLIAAVPAGAGPLHVVGAVIAIAGGNAAALAGSSLSGRRSYRRAARALGGTGLVCLAVLGASAWANLAVVPAPVWERAAVYSILAWQVGAALVCVADRGVTASAR